MSSSIYLLQTLICQSTRSRRADKLKQVPLLWQSSMQSTYRQAAKKKLTEVHFVVMDKVHDLAAKGSCGPACWKWMERIGRVAVHAHLPTHPSFDAVWRYVEVIPRRRRVIHAVISERRCVSLQLRGQVLDIHLADDKTKGT